MTTTDKRSAARGFGRYHQRLGVGRDVAVIYVVALYPELADNQDDIRRGWNAERRGR